MRINKYVASATGLSCRWTDQLIKNGKVTIDEQPTILGQNITLNQKIYLNSQPLTLDQQPPTIMFNKPVGYIVSKRGREAKLFTQYYRGSILN